MTLPGNITIGYLEEDVPQKAFFRIKPLFVKGNGAFEPVENAKEQFPDQGGIRIVPDKNESSRFKARMRTLGRYCVVDLSHHTTENDKIRPNKNYNPDHMELNRNIIYSDVVSKCPDDWISEVVRPELSEDGTPRATLKGRPATRHVTLIHNGTVTGPWLIANEQNGDEYAFRPDEAYEAFSADESTYMRLFTATLADDCEVEVIVSANGAPLYARKTNAEREIPAPEAPTVETETPAEPVKPVEAPAAPMKPETPAAPAKPEPVAKPEIPVKPETPVKPEAPVKREPSAKTELPAKPAPKAEPRPIPAPPARPPRPEAEIYPRPSLRAPFAGQTGLNPRRGRSLAEVIDDGWRKSRIDQLGAPIPGNAGGQPVLSPIERASESAKAAWALPEARATLIDELIGMDGFSEAVAPRFGRASEPATSGQISELNSFEEERLRIIGEIDELRRQRIEKRSEIMQEAREAHAEQVQKMREEIDLLTKERDARLRDAEDARKAQSSAQKTLCDENELIKFALHSHAAKLIRDWEGVDESDFAASPETYQPTGAQLVSDIRGMFENSGRPISNNEAVNLLACLAISPITVISGPTGCGKTSLAQMLASALGLTKPGAKRFISLANAPKPAREEAAFKALTRYEDNRSLRVVLLDDANQYPSIDITRDLIADLNKRSGGDSLRLILTVLDDQLGFPLNPRLLDRAFTVRMKMPDAPDWNAARPEIPCAARTVSLETLRAIFKGDGDIPGETQDRLNTLLTRLQSLGIRLSHRCLSDMRAYCASVTPLMNATPRQVLDYAFAQRALPAILASARLNVLKQLPEILCDLPMSLSLLNEPLPLPPI